MVAYDKLIIRRVTFSITLSARLFPRPSIGFRPTEVALSKVQNPSVVEAFELLGHIVCNMPNGGSVLIVDLTIIPHLRGGKWERFQ